MGTLIQELPMSTLQSPAAAGDGSQQNTGHPEIRRAAAVCNLVFNPIPIRD